MVSPWQSRQNRVRVAWTGPAKRSRKSANATGEAGSAAEIRPPASPSSRSATRNSVAGGRAAAREDHEKVTERCQTVTGMNGGSRRREDDRDPHLSTFRWKVRAWNQVAAFGGWMEEFPGGRRRRAGVMHSASRSRFAFCRCRRSSSCPGACYDYPVGRSQCRSGVSPIALCPFVLHGTAGIR